MLDGHAVCAAALRGQQAQAQVSQQLPGGQYINGVYYYLYTLGGHEE